MIDDMRRRKWRTFRGDRIIDSIFIWCCIRMYILPEESERKGKKISNKTSKSKGLPKTAQNIFSLCASIVDVD